MARPAKEPRYMMRKMSLLLIMITSLIIVVILFYHDSQKRYNHQQLNKSLDVLQDTLSSRGMSTQKYHICGNTDQVWGMGRQICAITLKTELNINSLDQANSNIREYNQIITSNHDFRTTKQFPLVGNNNTDGSAYYRHYNPKSNCDGGYTYNLQKASLQIEISCNDQF